MKIEELLRPHRLNISFDEESMPDINPDSLGVRVASGLFADPLQRIAFIEKAGTGIRRMREWARAHGYPEPEFSSGSFFSAIFMPIATRLPRKYPASTPQVAGQVAGQVTGQVAGQVTVQVAVQVAVQVTGQVAGQVSPEVLKMLEITLKIPWPSSRPSPFPRRLKYEN